MVNEVATEEFSRITKSSKEVFYDPLFLLATAKANKSNLKYFVFYKKSTPLIALALFIKGNDIVLPSSFLFYSGVWVSDNLESKQSRDALVECLLFLKQTYNKVELCLPLSLTDIRPFMWLDFDIRIRHTFIKKTGSKNFAEDVLNNYKRSLDLGLSFLDHSSEELDWPLFKEQLKSFNLPIFKINRMKDWLVNLHSLGMIFQFAVIKEGKKLGSAILLNDGANKKAYFLLRKIPESDIRKFVNCFLYVEVLNFLDHLHYLNLDYMGANIRSIAEFKSRFKPQLQVNYIVFHKKQLISIKNLKRKLKYYTIKLLNYFNR
ncbi:hypothetical protein I5M32_08720 [Pedobacter sp. SD-b]|uniref:Acetyltransferase (GNAT) domain-containing protein n=1 Tax=Pedobacter segetis TaxID=2793069 RepID=A0ABS1BJJ7_9SPHI|nr:hypothetical protein [Pedobacter segetis]MBK0383040.1 hypothetical protein [Pedobacter segetis]